MPTRSEQSTRDEAIVGVGGTLVGLATIVMALFPFLIPGLAIVALIALPLVLPLLLLGAVVLAVALPVRLIARAVRGRRRSGVTPAAAELRSDRRRKADRIEAAGWRAGAG